MRRVRSRPSHQGCCSRAGAAGLTPGHVCTWAHAYITHHTANVCEHSIHKHTSLHAYTHRANTRTHTLIPMYAHRKEVGPPQRAFPSTGGLMWLWPGTFSGRTGNSVPAIRALPLAGLLLPWQVESLSLVLLRCSFGQRYVPRLVFVTILTCLSWQLNFSRSRFTILSV